MRLYQIIREQNKDFLGELITKKKKNRLTQKLVNSRKERYEFFSKFLYRAEVRLLKRKRRSSGVFVRRLILRRKLFALYGFSRVKTFKKFLRLSVRGLSFHPALKTLMFLEGRLSVIVARLGLVSSILLGVSWVKKGVFSVNKCVIYDPGYIVKVGDVVEVVMSYRYVVFNLVYIRYFSRLFFSLYPKYFEMNYYLLSGVFYREPVFLELAHFSNNFPENYLIEEYRYLC